MPTSLLPRRPDGSVARPPMGQQGQEIDDVDGAGIVEVLGAPRARPPGREQGKEVKDVDGAAGVKDTNALAAFTCLDDNQGCAQLQVVGNLAVHLGGGDLFVWTLFAYFADHLKAGVQGAFEAIGAYLEKRKGKFKGA